MIQQLIALEAANDAALAARLKSCRAGKDALQVSRHNLGRIQRSYAPARTAAWHSYS